MARTSLLNKVIKRKQDQPRHKRLIRALKDNAEQLPPSVTLKERYIVTRAKDLYHYCGKCAGPTTHERIRMASGRTATRCVTCNYTKFIAT